MLNFNAKHVLIVHCHFERGGVTQVVENHVHCLADEVNSITLLSGERQSGLGEATLALVRNWTLPKLEYDSSDEFQGGVATRAQSTADEILRRCDQTGLPREEIIVHWHNHSLGKNAAAPLVIERLADAGLRCVLQIHDFAEDQRPANWLHLLSALGCDNASELDGVLYPLHANLRYATLTSGDASTLTRWGIDPSRVDVIPNSIRLSDEGSGNSERSGDKVRSAFRLPAEARWLLYPVRGIRRKNVGEFLLLCQLVGRPFVGGLTLRPATPLEAKSYDRWHRIAREHIDNIVFDCGQHPDVTFADNLAASHAVVSTSVAEGFGMFFLEPWLASRRVVARHLSGVTDDFVGQGLRLDDLYDAVKIPGSRKWLSEAETQFGEARRRSRADLSGLFSQDGFGFASEANDWVDFAFLTPELQADVIQRFATDPGFASDIRSLNRGLRDSLIADPDLEIIAHNRNVVMTKYGTQNQRDQLLAVYRKAFQQNATPTNQPTPSETMIQLVGQSRPFYPCRVERL